MFDVRIYVSDGVGFSPPIRHRCAGRCAGSVVQNDDGMKGGRGVISPLVGCWLVVRLKGLGWNPRADQHVTVILVITGILGGPHLTKIHTYVHLYMPIMGIPVMKKG